MSPRSTSRVRVRYAETDQMGVAWHGSYFAWFEVGRTDLLRERGLTYRELEAAGPAPARHRGAGPLPAARLYDDVLEIRTARRRASGARVVLRLRGAPRGRATSPLATG